MKRILCYLLLLCIVSSCQFQKKTVENKSAETSIAKNDKQQIRACFTKYKTSILNDEGDAAITCLDSRTLQYYQDISDKARQADSTEISNLELMDKLMVLTMRHRTSKEDLLNFDGKQLLKYSIQEGMVGKNSVANNELGEIIVEEDFAKGQLVASGYETPFYFHFYKEGEWKLDITSIFDVGAETFKNAVKGSGMDENEYILTVLEMVAGEKPADNIWDPITKN